MLSTKPPLMKHPATVLTTTTHHLHPRPLRRRRCRRFLLRRKLCRCSVGRCTTPRTTTPQPELPKRWGFHCTNFLRGTNNGEERVSTSRTHSADLCISCAHFTSCALAVCLEYRYPGLSAKSKLHRNTRLCLKPDYQSLCTIGQVNNVQMCGVASCLSV